MYVAGARARAGPAEVYFSEGQSALHTVVTALMARALHAGGEQPVASILDFGCGHGRVARYLRAAFPSAKLVVHDLNKAGVEWCVAQFGAVPLADPGERFDLIWLGSVFTHLDAATVAGLFSELSARLNPNGILVFTTHGRYTAIRAEQNPDTTNYGLTRPELDKVVAGFRSSGYGYRDHTGQQGYGISMADPSWFADLVRTKPHMIQVLYAEKAWANHQDAYAFVRRPII